MSAPDDAEVSFHVDLGDRSYAVSVGADILSWPEVWPLPTSSRKAMICLDSRLGHLREALLAGLSAAGWEPVCELLEASEQLKSIEAVFPLYGKLLAHGLQRRSLLVAVGGGTIGDAVGFVAATYLRGIPWVSVPSTLLAQVDSGLGGKTGINHPAGKNLIGAIWQPAAILCDTGLLRELPRRELVSGLGEMLKYGLIKDASFWDWIKAHSDQILAHDHTALATGISRSLRIKAGYVSADEQDLSGVRAALNFGHTFGHAIENCAGYGQFRHGEAVIWGMRLAAMASVDVGMLAPEAEAEIQAVLGALPVPPLPVMDPAALLAAIGHDKKREGAQVQTLLLKRIGEVETLGVDLSQWQKWIADFLAQHSNHPVS